MVRKNNETMPEPSRILTKDSYFNTVETYKSIRTSVMFSMPQSDKGKVIVVSSATPGEGKSTTNINLAITFAQTGARVIVIDCDLRKARVHKYLEIERGDGLSNVLCGFVRLENAIQKNVRENLDCLTAGAISPNPAELLETEQFAALLDTLREEYDYIFIDTPPITVVTDAVIVMKHCTGVVLVIRENVTRYDALDETVETIQKVGAKILGAIMVDSEERSRAYSYYRHNYRAKVSYYGDDKEAEIQNTAKKK